MFVIMIVYQCYNVQNVRRMFTDTAVFVITENNTTGVLTCECAFDKSYFNVHLHA